VADGVTHPGQLLGEVSRRFRSPPQRRFGITPCLGLNQSVQRINQFRIGDFSFFAPTSGYSDSIIGPFGRVADQFDKTTPDRTPGRTSGPLYCADSAMAPRFRLGRHRHTTIPFIQPRQQIRQTRLHRSEIIVIRDGHNADDFMD
jgi:hypothetical protein